MDNSNSDDVEVTVTDADMEDPELLAELAALTGGPPPAKPKPPADLAARASSSKREPRSSATRCVQL